MSERLNNERDVPRDRPNEEGHQSSDVMRQRTEQQLNSSFMSDDLVREA